MSPLWPLFPGTLLMLALLAAPGGARADSAPAAARSSLTELKGVPGGARADPAPAAARGGGARSCGRDQPRPTIAATTASKRSERLNSRSHLFSSYGDDITIFCSSNDASNLTIRDDDDHQLQAERLNSTTIQVTLVKPDVGEYNYHCTDSITTCTDTLRVYVGCGHRRPTIAVTTAGERRASYKYFAFLRYGDDITIFCSSNDASNLNTMRYGDHQLQAEHLNSTTIQMKLIKPDVGDYSYKCTDSITTCTDNLHLRVRYVMYVTAPNVHQRRDSYDITSYFVPRGEPYNLYCLYKETWDLRLTSYRRLDIGMVYRNKTTLMATVSDHTEGEREYICKNFRSIGTFSLVRVRVDYYPEARDFQCVLYQYSNLECSWKSSSKENIFTLSLLDNEKSTFFCSYSLGEFTASCKGGLYGNWLRYFMLFSNICLQLATCNAYFCSYQNFCIYPRSIIKLDPVDDLKVVNNSPQGVTVAWSNDNYKWSHTHKVEYRLLGTDWRAVNASTEHCEQSDTCELQLALPCPDAHYELRVYRRFKEATLDMYWSEPATVFFFTAPSTGGEVHPACRAEFREPEPTPSASIVALHEVRELISDERKDEPALKKYISGLKEKLAQIKALMDAQK